MELEEYERMYRLEDHHGWYVGMRGLGQTLLATYGGLSKPTHERGQARLLDAGCGTGGNLVWLNRLGVAFGFDLSADALYFCRLRGQPRLARASTLALPYRDASFDVVTSFDVLYPLWVSDDLQVLRELARVLRPEGRLLLRVPAYDWSRAQHDQAVHTRHGYTARELHALLHRVGFKPVRLSYVNTLLFPAIVLKRLLEPLLPRASERSELELGSGWLNNFVTAVLTLEARLVKRVNLPFGLSVLVLACKEV